MKQSFGSLALRSLSLFLGISLLAVGDPTVSHARTLRARQKPMLAQESATERVLEVRYAGMEHITPRDLESLLPFSPGDLWHPEFAGQVQKTIAEYYAKRGFFQAKVTTNPVVSESKNVLLMVKIEEGPPCVMNSIWIDDPQAFKSKHVMLRFKSKMSDVLKMPAGVRYDRQVLDDHLRELREWLIAENFILASTEKVRVIFNPAKTIADVVLAIDYGDRVTFGFQGNQIFTRGELAGFISEVRSTGLGKDYVGVIQRRFLEEYHNRAYNDAQIETKFGELPMYKHVTFLFDEGVRTELRETRWEGLSEENVVRAREVFQDGISRLVQRGYYVEKDVEKGVLLVLEDLKARGFLVSKLVSRSTQPVKSPEGSRRVKVVVQIAEGEQTMVGKIEMLGFEYFPLEKVRHTLNLVEEKPFNPFALEEGLQRLRYLYIQEGFLDFKFLTTEDNIVAFTENNRSVNVRLRVHEGTRIKIGDVKIRGLQKTKEYVVSREVTAQTDDWWLGSSIQEMDTNIRKLGLFSEVKIIAGPSTRGPGYRDLIFDLKEAEPGVIEAGPGFRTDLGARVFAKATYNNLFGRNWTVALGGEANRRLNKDYQFIEYKSELILIEPRFFSTRNLYQIGLSAKKERFPGTTGLNASTTQMFTGFERQIFKDLYAKVLYKYERIRQFEAFVNGLPFPEDNRSILIASVNPSLVLDTRDNPFATTSGWLLKGSLEYAHPNFSGQSVNDPGAPGYQKWTGSVHKYTSLTKDIVWSNVFAGGFARSNIAGHEIPFVKLFRLGGAGTIRGFQEDTINFDAVSIKGTLTYINLRTQFELPLVGELKLAPFLDAGNLFKDTFRGGTFFRAGAGVGLHYITPIGPINLDWGFKLNPTPNETPSQIHFSVGLI